MLARHGTALTFIYYMLTAAGEGDYSYRDALIIGLAQACCWPALPGTVVDHRMGLLLGNKKSRRAGTILVLP